MPMLVKDELVGTLSIAAVDPYRFERADEHLLRIIAGQIGVAVQNARLHDVRPSRQAGVGAHLRRDQRSDCGVRQPGAAAPRQQRARGAPRPARHGSAALDVPRHRVLRRHRFRGARSARRRSTARLGASRSRSERERSSASRRSRSRARETGRRSFRWRRTSRRKSGRRAGSGRLSEEARVGERTPDGDGRAAQVDAGAAAPVGEALGDRPAGRGRRARIEQPADERHRIRAAARGGAAGAHAVRSSCGGHRSWPRIFGASSTNRSARRGSSATCWRSRGARPQRARPRTSPTSSRGCCRCAPTTSA